VTQKSAMTATRPPQTAEPSQSGPEPGDISFVEHFLPLWESGAYTVKAVQAVSSDDKSNPFRDDFGASLTFAVQGPRFSLPPDRIVAAYPPAGGNADYTNVLPHVVFADETLPWQRSPGEPSRADLKPTPTGVTDPISPWLALLVFDNSDPAPELTTGTVEDLSPAKLPEKVISYPALRDGFEIGERTKDGYAACSYIDVPSALFSAIAPAFADLYWLTHSREVSEQALKRKIVANDKAPPTRNAVVVGNRLPRRDSAVSCYLVSVEGMAPYLPPTPLVDVKAVRLAVLTSWKFGCAGDAQTFADTFSALDKTPITLQRPTKKLGGTSAANEVAHALEMGYTAFTHRTRQGAKTVSWYRGPLIPFANVSVLSPPYPSADSLLRYDPNNGLLDASYAAAWQLGQLLALADKDYATTLYNWKLGRQQAAVDALEQQVLEQRVGVQSNQLTAPDSTRSELLMQSVLKPLLSAFLTKKESQP
jgi:hypothetical protein